MKKDAFLKKLNQLLSGVEDSMEDDAKVRMVKAYWQAGRLTEEYRQATGALIKDIAKEAGVEKQNLQLYRQFYSVFPGGYPERCHGRVVYWSAVRMVLPVHEAAARLFYLEESCRLGWSKFELRQRIKNNFYYEAKGRPVPAKIRAALSRKKFWLYTFAAEVIRVIDGDTMDLDIDTGFKSRQEHRVRLKGINCPEMSEPEGPKAKEFVQAEMDKCIVSQPLFKGRYAPRPLVVIQTYKMGIYGRYIVDLFYKPGEAKADLIAENGLWLNQVLLDKKLAKRMDR